MSPNVKMICKECQTVTVVREIIFRTDGLFEVQCFNCNHAQTYGERK